MKLYRVSQDDKTAYLSPEPISPDEISVPGVIDEIERDVPTVFGRLELWEGDDGQSYPHLHYVCPRCTMEHNVDLYPNDGKPRFACCDSCKWESVVWIQWNRNELAKQDAPSNGE